MATRRRFDSKFKERVLQYAEQNSEGKTAKHFNIAANRIRYWRKQREELLLVEPGRAPLAGGGRKVSEELEEKLEEWIYDHDGVSRNAIKQKALEIYAAVSGGGKTFVAGAAWLQKFLQRNDLPLRRRSGVPQLHPKVLGDRLVWFLDRVARTMSSKKISESDVIAMDETAVCFDGAVLPSQGGHKKSRLTVVLAAAADGTKLKPFIVFRWAAGEVAAMLQQVPGAVVNTSVNGSMSHGLTADWLQAVMGNATAAPRLLVWDSYRCHLGAAAKAELRCGYNVTTATVPAGCSSYVHAPELRWKTPFRQSLQDAYARWRAGDAHKELTAGGELKPPARRLLVDWVVSAWEDLDPDLIRESFKVCGLSVKGDGSEDHLIDCFREGQPCAAGRDTLTRVRQQDRENQDQEDQQEEDDEELFNNELVVLDEEEVRPTDPVKPATSGIQTRGEAAGGGGGGGAAHLQCTLCGHFSKSHVHQLTHVAASHPSCLDGVVVGRLGNILMYQSTARLFHCCDCFFTSRDFTKLYKHLVSRHCVDEKTGEEGEEEEEGGADALKRKRSSEEEEDEEEEGQDEEKEESVKAGGEGDESVLMFDGAGYHCLICGWKTKLKALGVNHVVRKHDIPKALAAQAVRRDAAATPARQAAGGGVTEEEEAMAGLSGKLLKEEMEATAKVVRFISNRFVCLICGWKTKLKGFAISHVVRCHDVERPYACRVCQRSFFLPSRRQQHVRAAHRPGRYACPFCCFRSHFLGGFRRHCSRCNAREEGGQGPGPGPGPGPGVREEEENEEEERTEGRRVRKRRRTEKVKEEEEEDDD